MEPTGLPPKKDVLDELLARGSARIFLDPRRPGVVVPKSFANQAELVLRVGYSLKPAIVDLQVDDQAVSCTLSFNRTPCWCNLPWSAVFAVVSDVGSRGVVWPDDVPIESQLLKVASSKPKLASVPSERAPSDRQKQVRRAPRRDRDGDTFEEPPPVVSQPAAADAGASPASSGRSFEPRPSSGQVGKRLELTPVAAPAVPSDRQLPSEQQMASDKSMPSSSENKKKPKRELPPYLRVVK
jgi:stringent starvation protein B